MCLTDKHLSEWMRIERVISQSIPKIPAAASCVIPVKC
jgi:hypothetical protein